MRVILILVLGLVASMAIGDDMTTIDTAMEGILAKWKLAGGAVAVVKDDRLVFAKGYGFADKEKTQPPTPESLFRIASVSKPITSVAIMKLVEDGKLKLDDKAFDILKDINPMDGATVDPRTKDITILQLLQHSGGWDRDKSGDPMFMDRQIAEEMKVALPVDQKTRIRWMLGRPLDFDPGKRSAYSNFGYCVLGRVIEKVSGQSYEAYVCRKILTPMGIKRMKLGRSLIEKQAKDEVHYFFLNDRMGESVVTKEPRQVLAPYGTFNIEAMDAHGGWIASVVDLMRFVVAIDGRGRTKSILKQSSIDVMVGRPDRKDAAKGDRYYACGWDVIALPTDKIWMHSGKLAGSADLIVRYVDGMSWIVIFNDLPRRPDPFYGDFDNVMRDAILSVKEWPDVDLFKKHK